MMKGRSKLTGIIKSVEDSFISELELTAAESILQKFSSLVRESGSEDERKAASFLESFLQEWQIPYMVHNPKLYLSLPRKAIVNIISPTSKSIMAKTPSSSFSTDGLSHQGEVIYLASDVNLDDKYDQMAKYELGFVKGKVVLMDGYPVSGKVKEFGDAGAVGVVFISPGEYIHEGTCSAVWGSPDLSNIDDEPIIPVVAISLSDGEALKNQLKAEKVEIQLQTQLEKGWYECPLLDVFIQGTDEPEKYVLLHGHLDSWHVGIGDNATGAAALMEMARVLYKNRHQLKRSIRIAIWPGHSTGRYAGSTWFADEFGLDLEENCIAQVNCDSPGCRWATSYEYMNWMSETDEFCKEAIEAAVGKYSKGARPPRAGDYSFNNIGITSFFMLSSSIPDEIAAEKGYYPVGGCGGNIQWHTEEDELFVADYDVLLDDMKIYLTSVIRVVNEPIHPFKYVNTVDEILKTLEKYDESANSHLSFSELIREAEQLRTAMEEFYHSIHQLENKSVKSEDVKEANRKMRELSRLLIRLNYSRKGEFRHDPALDVPPIPDLAPAVDLPKLQKGSHSYFVTLNHLKRGANRVQWTLRLAKKLVEGSR
jgi:N-acetylated-alpha-linked acidic dipeptidase